MKPALSPDTHPLESLGILWKRIGNALDMLPAICNNRGRYEDEITNSYDWRKGRSNDSVQVYWIARYSSPITRSAILHYIYHYTLDTSPKCNDTPSEKRPGKPDGAKKSSLFLHKQMYWEYLGSMGSCIRATIRLKWSPISNQVKSTNGEDIINKQLFVNTNRLLCFPPKLGIFQSVFFAGMYGRSSEEHSFYIRNRKIKRFMFHIQLWNICDLYCSFKWEQNHVFV